MSATGVVIGIEGVKLLLMIALEEMQRQNLTEEQQADFFYQVRKEFIGCDPVKIPEV